jgi:hypothetical protein
LRQRVFLECGMAAMDPLEAMATLLVVVEAGSLSAA